MIRHIRWLSQPVPSLGVGALGVAVYSRPAECGYEYQVASESGCEGVACLDDVARAAILFCRIWRRGAQPWALRSALGFLAFVIGMQDKCGRFTNFITSWDGALNTEGSTSYPGGPWWTARALHALAEGYATFGDRAFADAFCKGLPHFARGNLPAGPAALGILATLRFWEETRDPDARLAVDRLIEAVMRTRDGSLLLDDGEYDPAHLWGRYQEMALALAGRLLGRSELIRLAEASAAELLEPAAEMMAYRAPMLPYEAGCVARGLYTLGQITGAPRYMRLARGACQWFDVSNASGIPVYDRIARQGVRWH